MTLQFAAFQTSDQPTYLTSGFLICCVVLFKQLFAFKEILYVLNSWRFSFSDLFQDFFFVSLDFFWTMSLHNRRLCILLK